MKTKRRSPVFLRAALVLLCLVLVSMHFTAGMYARYITKASGSDRSRLSGFAVSAEGEKDPDTKENSPVMIVADGTDSSGKATYQIVISNPGETAVHYEAEVRFADEETAKMFAPGEDNKNLSFSGELAPKGKCTEEITLDMSKYFQDLDTSGTFSNDDTSGAEGKIPFEVIVTFTQIH